MNNCYGKNGDMQQRFLKIMPDIGPTLYVLICVPDTDDYAAIEEYTEGWMDHNMEDIFKCHKDFAGVEDTLDYTYEEIMNPSMSTYTLLTTCVDSEENELSIYQ